MYTREEGFDEVADTRDKLEMLCIISIVDGPNIAGIRGCVASRSH